MKKIIFSFALLLLCWSCTENASDAEAGSTEEPNTSTALIQFTEEQIEMAGIKTGTFEVLEVAEIVECTGIIEAMPNNLANVSVPVASYISKIHVMNGEEVTRGQTVLTIQHLQLIQLQQEYLVAKSQMEYLENEYNRQKQLLEENATAEKNYQKARSEYLTNKVEIAALAAQLRMFNINPEQLTSENIREKIAVKAPISGYIDEVLVNIGQYVEPTEVLFKILNRNNFELELHIFEKDMHKIEVGQKLRFHSTIGNSEECVAEIENIGQILDENSKTYRAHAYPDKIHPQLRHGMYIQAEIQAKQHEAHVLPEEAFVTEAGQTFVFIAKDNGFEKYAVTTGITQDSKTEVINYSEIPDNVQIVLTGANYIQAEMNKQE